MIENRELVRKNSARRLHGNPPDTAPVHPRAETPQDSAACCELYARIDMKYLLLGGDWLTRAGFINGMPVKIRAMKDCIVITPQTTMKELKMAATNFKPELLFAKQNQMLSPA